MDYTHRFVELNTLFELGKTTALPDSNCHIQFFPFQSKTLNYGNNSDSQLMFSDRVSENKNFTYPVFVPNNMTKSNEAILLMHGLNERNWNKYLTWAEYLCNTTGKVVILFPIAYHINRSPSSWSNPHYLNEIYHIRKSLNATDRSISFANVALSERISENPHRFYSSGRQSLDDITRLVTEIKSGFHPLFEQQTHIDVFAYSIGAFLSQITFLTNPNELFTDSKLFMFCGGGIFSSMFGQSRTIMDRMAFDSLFNYYLNDFSIQNEQEEFRDKVFRSFNAMISPERSTAERQQFFENMENRLTGISLIRDTVIPYSGVEKALGDQLAHKNIDAIDFDFEYCHENPFPVNSRTDSTKVDASFSRVFSKAAEFLS